MDEQTRDHARTCQQGPLPTGSRDHWDLGPPGLGRTSGNSSSISRLPPTSSPWEACHEWRRASRGLLGGSRVGAGSAALAPAELGGEAQAGPGECETWRVCSPDMPRHGRARTCSAGQQCHEQGRSKGSQSSHWGRLGRKERIATKLGGRDFMQSPAWCLHGVYECKWLLLTSFLQLLPHLQTMPGRFLHLYATERGRLTPPRQTQSSLPGIP